MTRKKIMILGALVGVAMASAVWIVRFSYRPTVSDEQAQSVGYDTARHRNLAHRVIQDAVIGRRLTDEDFGDLVQLVHSPGIKSNSKWGLIRSLGALKDRQQQNRALECLKDFAADADLRSALISIGTQFMIDDPTVLDGWSESADPNLRSIANEAGKAAQEKKWLLQQKLNAHSR